MVVDAQSAPVVAMEVQDGTLAALYPQHARQYRLHHAADLWALTKESITTLRRLATALHASTRRRDACAARCESATALTHCRCPFGAAPLQLLTHGMALLCWAGRDVSQARISACAFCTRCRASCSPPCFRRPSLSPLPASRSGPRSVLAPCIALTAAQRGQPYGVHPVRVAGHCCVHHAHVPGVSAGPMVTARPLPARAARVRLGHSVLSTHAAAAAV